MSLLEIVGAAYRKIVRRPQKLVKTIEPAPAAEEVKQEGLDQVSGGKVQMQDFHFTM